MGKYFKVGKLLIDIEPGTALCIEGGNVTGYCPIAAGVTGPRLTDIFTWRLTDKFTPTTHLTLTISRRCCDDIGSNYRGGFVDKGDPMIDFTNPQVIANLREVLTQEIARLDRVEKILEVDMTPSSFEEVAAIEKHLDIAQGQLEEARKDLAQKKSQISNKGSK